MKLIPSWVSKTNPEKHPVRFLVSLWEQGLGNNFGVAATPLESKQFGQFKKLREALDNLTLHVVEWMLKPENWYHFSQQVRSETKQSMVPTYPDIGFLLLHRNRALRIMREKLRASTAEPDVGFCTKLDEIRYEQMKRLVVVLSDGRPEVLAKIKEAKTLINIEQVFIEMGEGKTVPEVAAFLLNRFMNLT